MLPANSKIWTFNIFHQILMLFSGKYLSLRYLWDYFFFMEKRLDLMGPKWTICIFCLILSLNGLIPANFFDQLWFMSKIGGEEGPFWHRIMMWPALHNPLFFCLIFDGVVPPPPRVWFFQGPLSYTLYLSFLSSFMELVPFHQPEGK